MKILMLGWEYPPHISGGLGTACEGLTRALARSGGCQITFIVPCLFGGEQAPHMHILDAFEIALWNRKRRGQEGNLDSDLLRTLRVPALLKPYLDADEYQTSLSQLASSAGQESAGLLAKLRNRRRSGQYGKDIFAEVMRYAKALAPLAEHLEFDLIHAHDWMTYPAGIELAKRSGKPLLVHVHSLETDRSGPGVDRRIHQIEAMGVTRADAVIAVSHYTRSIINKVHRVPLPKIFVVHNGIYPNSIKEHYRKSIGADRRVVLFLGRVTYQKGPEFFVEAAARVVPRLPEARFILAGSGDMLPRVAQRVNELGMRNNFAFTGFLRGTQVERAFALADLYVMPSVSEPFGISALEAINFDTPALISRQSGVAEVLHHAMKFDYWDIDRLADLIYNGLLYDELRYDMIEMARTELQKLRWDQAAQKTMRIYQLFLRPQ